MAANPPVARSHPNPALATPSQPTHRASPFCAFRHPQNEVNGPEPQPEHFPCEPLEPLPEFVAPAMEALPPKPPLPVPKMPCWVPPCEPRPIGFLRGVAPVLIVDVSGEGLGFASLEGFGFASFEPPSCRVPARRGARANRRRVG